MDMYRRARIPSDRSSPSPSDLALHQGENETGNDDEDSIAERVINKASVILMQCMDPDPILECALSSDLFEVHQVRDMRESKNTSDKNRILCDNICKKGRLGYEKLKEWLRETHQKDLAQVLELIEEGKDYSRLLETIKQKIKEKEAKVLQDQRNHGMSEILGHVYNLFGFGKEDLLKELQGDLISFYKHQHRCISLSPLLDDDQPLLKFYVMPDIQSVKVTRTRDGNIEEKTPVRALRDVFYKENKLCSNIYLTADAGLGKTAFSKRLVLAWCHSKKPDESEDDHFSEEEISDMRGFSFVFLVLLRDSSSECNIDMMIWNQIFSQLPHDYKWEDMRKTLCDETCLIVLDGLDEWTHPLNSCSLRLKNIPHQIWREKVAVLTTTRPWKLSVSGQRSSEIDHKLELRGLSDESAKKLKRSVISHLYGGLDEEKIDEYEAEFSETTDEKHRSDLTAIPLFLMYLLFLRYYKFSVGKSLTDLYSNFIELLLSRTVEKDWVHTQRFENVQANNLVCFFRNRLCKQFFTLLTSLGQLAFKTLFSDTKENTLVFDGSVAKKYLKDDLMFSLSTGIITQSKVQGASLLEHKTKVSFAHKTVQEFLAAIYICSSPNQRSVQNIVLSKCKGVKDILGMSKIFVFTIGIDAKSPFSQKLMKIINEDKVTLEYRMSLQDHPHPLQDLQEMYISCYKEIPHGNEASLCIQDVFIDYSCTQEEYREHLRQLTTRNKQNIRSLYFDMSHMEDTPYNTASKVIDYFALKNLENIEKLYYSGKYINDAILPLFSSSVKCLYLSCDREQPGTWSRLLFDTVVSLRKLEAIKLSWFKMSHSDFRSLLDNISQRDLLKEIQLEELDCVDHGRSCVGLSVDFTQNSSLRELTLGDLHLSQVKVNMASLEKCCLRELFNPDFVLEFLNRTDSILNTLICERLKSSAAIDAVLDTLSLSRNIRHVKLSLINLGSRTLISSDCVNIVCLELSFVTMEASKFGELVESVLNLQQKVSVFILGCTISPIEEFKTVKEKIKSSQRLRTLEDGNGRCDSFMFETIISDSD